MVEESGGRRPIQIITKNEANHYAKPSEKMNKLQGSNGRHRDFT